jgi:hypothetical protein
MTLSGELIRCALFRQFKRSRLSVAALTCPCRYRLSARDFPGFATARDAFPFAGISCGRKPQRDEMAAHKMRRTFPIAEGLDQLLYT